MATRTFKGSCHCGAIRFDADIDLQQGTGKCNCTFCTKARSWKVFVKPEAFRMSGDEAAVGYHGNPQAPLKFFCRKCGIHTHERGDSDYMGGEFVGIFVATLDDVDPNELANAPIRYSDGRHDNWRSPPADIRNL
jgi:hypothetical protein